MKWFYLTDYFKNCLNCRPYMECAAHIWDVKNFPMGSTGSSKSEKASRKQGLGMELSFINQLYLATSQTQATARLNFPHRRLTFGFYAPGPAYAPSHTSHFRKNSELMVWILCNKVPESVNDLTHPFMCCLKDDITIILENGKVENFCPDFVNFKENSGNFLEISQKIYLKFGVSVMTSSLAKPPPSPSSSIVIIWKPPPP